jgi:hypothetical protein
MDFVLCYVREELRAMEARLGAVIDGRGATGKRHAEVCTGGGRTIFDRELFPVY